MNKIENLAVEYIDIERLKPYENNAKQHKDLDVNAIAESISTFGFNDPIGIYGDENIIVEGHGRMLAAKKLGMNKVPCIRLDHLTDEERRAYTLAHNKTAELASWDLNILSEEIKDLSEFDMGSFGFDLSFEDVEIEDNNEPNFIDEYSEKYNIIIACENLNEAKDLKEKLKLNIDLTRQRLLVKYKEISL